MTQRAKATAVTHDDRSYMIGGKRVWLASAAIHYCRVPRALWRDRFIKARQCGINCVETIVPWNFHEPREGEWNFEGDADIAAYFGTAAELGLHGIVRPGPYICGEWDFGGYPAWLTTKKGIEYRTGNAVYRRYYRRFLDRLLPRLAPLQATRGGNILLIQNENEYYMHKAPGCASYLADISEQFRRHGFDIPIINCNRFSSPPTDSIECVNTWETEVQDIKRIRARQPGAPVVVTEFWCGSFDQWGGAHRVRDAAGVARRTLEILGSGGQINYYMWHGGTNFAHWGSRLIGSEAFYQATTYDYDAPLAEGGGLTEKYHLTRLVNTLGTTFCSYFAESRPAAPAGHIHGSPTVLNLSGPRGSWIFVTNGGMEDLQTARVSLPDGREVPVSLEPFGGAALPWQLRLDGGPVVDWSNVTPFGLFGKVVVFHGPAGWPATVQVDGKRIDFAIPPAGQTGIVRQGGYSFVFVETATIPTIWPAGDRLVVGPEFVEPDGTVKSPASGDGETTLPIRTIATATGKPGRASARCEKRSPLPVLGAWERLGSCPEAPGGGAGWREIAGPTDFDRLGNYYGYGWYRTEIRAAKARRVGLVLPDSGDRVTVFRDGGRIGTWGAGIGAVRTPLEIALRAGSNPLVLLADNMGRYCHTHKMGELKGVWGGLWDAAPLAVPAPAWSREEGFDESVVTPMQRHRLRDDSIWPPLCSQPVWRATYRLGRLRESRMYLEFSGIPHTCAVFFDGKCLGFFPMYAPTFGEMVVDVDASSSAHELSFLVWGARTPGSAGRVRLLQIRGELTEGSPWSFRPLDVPPAGLVPARRGLPAWFANHFACDALPTGPVFLHLRGAAKGQVYLNGHNAGRHWCVGPQEAYYLPECWFKAHNELLVFDEFGKIPAGSRLVEQPTFRSKAWKDGHDNAFHTV